MRFRQVFVDCPLALDPVGHCIDAQPVDPEIEPVTHHVEDGSQYSRIIEVEIGLVGIKTVPVIGLRHRVPRPVRLLGIDKDDTGFLEFLVRITPHIKVTERRAGLCKTRTLKPGMLIGGMVDDQFGDDAQIATVCLAHEGLEIRHPSIGWIDVLVIRDVVAIIAQWRGIERQQPQRGDPEIVEIIELAAQTLKIADSVVIGVEEGLHVQLIDDRIPVPEWVRARRLRQFAAAGQRGRSVVGWGHMVVVRSRRKIIDGLVSGSRQSRWRVPRQVTTSWVKAPSSENSASSDKPNSASGSSTSPSCTACGSRLTATITVFARSTEVLA